MQISHILQAQHGHSRHQLLFSRIESDFQSQKLQKVLKIVKIPLANKQLILQFQERKSLWHVNLPQIQIDYNSNFYITVYLQKNHPFQIKDLLIHPFQQRTLILMEILKAAKLLSRVYGYFYITQKMLGYNSRGKITLWINQESIQNHRSYPINHGNLSQQIFVADFKVSFGYNFKEMKQFHKAKTVQSLLQLLEQGCKLFSSIYISEPANKESSIFMNNSNLIYTSQIGFTQSSIYNQRTKVIQNFKRQLQSNQSLHHLKRDISFSYLPQQKPQVFTPQPKKLLRTLSASLNFQNPRMSTFESGLSFSKHITNSQNLIHSTSSTHLTRSSLPKISFSYQSKDNSWKKKPDQKFTSLEPTFKTSTYQLKKSASISQGVFSSEGANDSLKTSFPHTTNHTFVPFASNGNISLNCHDSINFQKKGISIPKQVDYGQSNFEPHISEQSNEVEMDLQNLFSDSQGQLHSHEQFENMEMIMEEFESIIG